MIRKSLLLLFFITSSVKMFSKDIELKNSLRQSDPITGTSVTVNEHGSAASATNSSPVYPEKKIRGYRVRIFFDNGQDARVRSNTVLEQFRNNFPDIPVYWSYDNPYFKVTVGDCLTSEEAIVIWGRVKNVYDKAFVVREDIPLKNFMYSPAVIPETEEIPEYDSNSTL